MCSDSSSIEIKSGLKVGDVVKVKVIGVDIDKKRISLTIKGAVDDELTEGL